MKLIFNFQQPPPPPQLMNPFHSCPTPKWWLNANNFQGWVQVSPTALRGTKSKIFRTRRAILPFFWKFIYTLTQKYIWDLGKSCFLWHRTHNEFFCGTINVLYSSNFSSHPKSIFKRVKEGTTEKMPMGEGEGWPGYHHEMLFLLPFKIDQTQLWELTEEEQNILEMRRDLRFISYIKFSHA